MPDVLFKAFFSFWSSGLFPAVLLLFALQAALLREAGVGFSLVGAQFIGDAVAFLILLFGAEQIFQLFAVRLILFLLCAGVTAWIGIKSILSGIQNKAQGSVNSSSETERFQNQNYFLVGLLLRFTLSNNFYWWSGAGAAQLHQAQGKAEFFGTLFFVLGMVLAALFVYALVVLVAEALRKWLEPFGYRVMAYVFGGGYVLFSVFSLVDMFKLIF